MTLHRFFLQLDILYYILMFKVVECSNFEVPILINVSAWLLLRYNR